MTFPFHWHGSRWKCNPARRRACSQQ